jgi:acylpyruvate hydrolase
MKSMLITLPQHDLTVRPGKILCIGRNYAAHAREMMADVPDAPVVFLKPSTALLHDGGTIMLPAMTQDVHHEVELVVVIGREGKHIAEADALAHVAAYAVGLDMTARDIQARAKEKREPWSVAKGFDTFAPLGQVSAASEVGDPHDLHIELKVNGEIRQSGSTADMIFSIQALIAYCSRVFTLEPGDLLYTGTPEGVGPVKDGDELVATVSGLEPLRVNVERPTDPA